MVDSRSDNSPPITDALREMVGGQEQTMGIAQRWQVNPERVTIVILNRRTRILQGRGSP